MGPMYSLGSLKMKEESGGVRVTEGAVTMGAEAEVTQGP